MVREEVKEEEGNRGRKEHLNYWHKLADLSEYVVVNFIHAKKYDDVRLVLS